MLWQRIRIALLTGALVAATGLTAWAAEEDKDKDAPKTAEQAQQAEKIGPPAQEKPTPPPPSPCAPKTCTVWVNEWVSEQVPATRTVYTSVPSDVSGKGASRM